MTLTCTDLFCGAGGSSVGAAMAGAELRLGLNHSQRAIETHSHNFPDADHDCEDIASLTTAQIRRYPDSDILLASPECTGHSLAKGARRRKPQAASLFDDGPASTADHDRSRATMWDVPRFAEQKILKGKPYKALVIENVVDAFVWGENNNGMLFQAWLQALSALGYDHHIVWLNSMFVPPTPQSRDRMYVVLWRRGIRPPDLRVEPECWCESCGRLVAGKQTFKKREGPRWGRYGAQYYYSCPHCYGTVIPGACPASSIIDYSLEAPLIGEREKPLAKNTRERIRRGLERLRKEPFAIRLTHGAAPKPLTLPLVNARTRPQMSMVMPVSGNTHEATPGNRAKDAHIAPLATVHGTLDRALVTRNSGGAPVRGGSEEPAPTLTASKDRTGSSNALVMANTEHNVPRDAAREAAQTLRTEGGLALAYTNRAHGVPKQADLSPTTTACTGGHLGVVVSNYSPGWTRRAAERPVGSVTTQDGHSLVLPYTRSTRTTLADREAVTTMTTRDRLALLTPDRRHADDEDHFRASTGSPAGPTENDGPVTEDMIDSCSFRMFSLDEIARAMALDKHVNGNEYVLIGNRKQRTLMLGNAVTPPVMDLLVSRVLSALDEA